ncbi:DUF3800 domain-containing protein [Sphingopyxis sp.]|uniref:DUF3800 domain-containing protein n=1 Tax=Sphingopyxis sp. TaxID=1908224 RepID=UPI002ED815E1
MATNIYCDDAGFTGDNLLNVDQPYFAYSAIAIGPDAAAELIAELRARFRIRDPEIKGMALYQRPYALAAIGWLLGELGDRASVAVSDKLYSLACKFFEYVFEPVLARNSLFFYERGFHLHVANVIWAHLVRGDMSTARIAGRFEALMRRRRGEPQLFFEPHHAAGQPNPIDAIQRFAHACRSPIEKEMAGLADENGRVKWVLDLSFSSAKSVLCTMGERFGALDVMFDDSKPLLAYRDFFDSFIDRIDVPYMTLRGRSAPLVFNLAKPVAFGSSKQEPGLQLADLVASFSALAARDRQTTRGQEILAACLPWFNDESVWPDLDHLRLDRKENALNAVMLLELVARAEAGEDVVEGMPLFYESASSYYEVSPPFGLAGD